jgi:hypothetical protein
MMTLVPVALAGSGRKAVNVGVATLKTTVPSGVLSTVVSCWVQCSELGATPGQTFTLPGDGERPDNQGGRRGAGPAVAPLLLEEVDPRGRRHLTTA